MHNSISTSLIEAIISRQELIDYATTIEDSPLVLISISEPIFENYADEALPTSITSKFKDSLSVKFWDIEDDIPPYLAIPDAIAYQLQQFILANIDQRFIIHCRAGVSRSAGVGKAIECIKYFGIGEQARYDYSTCFTSEIDQHIRYFPNRTVFTKITKDYDGLTTSTPTT